MGLILGDGFLQNEGFSIKGRISVVEELMGDDWRFVDVGEELGVEILGTKARK